MAPVAFTRQVIRISSQSPDQEFTAMQSVFQPARAIGPALRLTVLVLVVIFVLCVAYDAAPGWAANGSVAYTYDALGRVTTASYDTGVCIVYSYDPNGNRTSETVSLGTVNTPTWGTGVWGCFNWTAH